MKKIIISLITIGILIGGFFLYKELTKKEADDTPTSKEIEIDAVLLEGNMNTITVKTSKGAIYTFLTEDVDMSKVDGLIIGRKLHIKYKEEIDDFLEIQTNEIIDIYTVGDINKYPAAWNYYGIFSDYYEQAYEKLKDLSIEEKIGQLIFARVPESNQVSEIEKYHLGGYILFGRDTKNKTKEQLTNTIKSYQNASSIPLIIATDEEGGIVVRVSNNSKLADKAFKSSQELYKEGGFDLIKKDTKEKSELLSSLGINTNLAPVSDVSTNKNDYIYSRTFGKNATETSKYVETVIEASKGTNVSYVLKHFPGYGNNLNTHTGSATDKRSYKTFETSDFLPFEAGIKAGAEAVLVSHNIVNSIDSSAPASLSVKMHNLLREKLEFTGIIITDDLAMDAINDYVSNPAVKAILAGNDLLIVSDYKKAYNDIKEAVEKETITEELLDELVFKVLSWKYYKGLIK